MATLAIKGHPTRGKEVIQLLEMLGGENSNNLKAISKSYFYYIKDAIINNICYLEMVFTTEDFKIYTLEEFEKKFPYRVGDKVIYEDKRREITKMVWEEQTNTIAYKLDDKLYCNVINDLQPYKESKCLQEYKEYLDNIAREKLDKTMDEKEIALSPFKVGDKVIVKGYEKMGEDEVIYVFKTYDGDIKYKTKNHLNTHYFMEDSFTKIEKSNKGENMEKKINIAEILKDCPKGMELDCLLFENTSVYLSNVTTDPSYPIEIKVEYPYKELETFALNKYGAIYDRPTAKCVIFPKGKTTWEGFQPFVDGVILATDLGSVFYLNTRLNTDECYGCYVGIGGDGSFHICGPFAYKECCGFATEEEKQKLFDAIKANGYQWNAETKTLEKLEDVEDKGNISDGYHTFNELYEYRLLYNASMFNELAKQGLYDVHKSKFHSDGTIPFGDENWFIVQAELPTGQISNHYEMKDWDLFQVPIKEKANQYDGHTPQDVAKRLRDFLTLKKLVVPKFKVGDKIRHKTNPGRGNEVTEIKDTHYILDYEFALPFLYQDQYELISNKFDIANLKPFEKVLVRQNVNGKWGIDFFGFYTEGYYYTTGSCIYVQCIPYEGNEHLLGTTNDCDDFYKTWK